MRAAIEGNLPPVMPKGNLVGVLGREMRQGLPGELMVESSPSHLRRPPCKTNKEMSDQAADAAALTYLLTRPPPGKGVSLSAWSRRLCLGDSYFPEIWSPKTLGLAKATAFGGGASGHSYQRRRPYGAPFPPLLPLLPPPLLPKSALSPPPPLGLPPLDLLATLQ